VVLVLVSIFVVLQKDLNFVVHLRSNVVAKAASNDSQNTKTKRTQGRRSKADNVRLLKSRATCCDDTVRDSRHFGESRCAERQSRKECRCSIRGETRRNHGSGYELGSFGGLYIGENRLVDCRNGQESVICRL
jgi:hypothetical protein